jgi:hypothetical protein
MPTKSASLDKPTAKYARREQFTLFCTALWEAHSRWPPLAPISTASLSATESI